MSNSYFLQDVYSKAFPHCISISNFVDTVDAIKWCNQKYPASWAYYHTFEDDSMTAKFFFLHEEAASWFALKWS